MARLSFTFHILLLGSIFSFPLYGQTGKISGQITDQQQAIVPSATVQIINTSTMDRRTAASSQEGKYVADGLVGGFYQVIVEAQGFSPFTSEPIDLKNGQSRILDIQLSVAVASSEVTVEGGGNQIELDNPALSGTLDEKEVTSLGLNGRNFTQLITLTPGVSNQTGQDEAKVGVAGSAKFSVNGGRVEYNTFEVDGSDVLNTSINASRGQAQPLIVYPSVDAIQGIQVLTSNYGAMYGKSASGSVVVSTKSGTPAFHGNGYEFLRNEAFNARNYFDITKSAPLYRRNDFGATIGGPLFIPKVFNQKKDRAFFFFSEEFRIEKTPVQYNQGVPSAQERTGDFSDACPQTSTFAVISYPDCPSFAGQPGVAPTAKAWSAIGQQEVSPTATALLNTGVIPLPTATTGCTSTISSCYDATVSPSTFYREELFRIDYNLSTAQQIYFRYIHDSWNTTTLTPQWGVVQNSFPTVRNKLNGPGIDLVAGVTQTLPHAFLNRIALAYAAAHITLATESGPGVDLSRSDAGLNVPCHQINYTTVGAPSSGEQGTFPGSLCPLGYLFPSAPAKNLIPGLEFNGTNPAYGGHGFAVDTGYAPWEDANPTYMLRDDVSKAWGKHTIQFGGQWVVAQQNELSGVNGANSGDVQGLLSYSNQISPRTSNNAFADFLGNVQVAQGVASQVGSSTIQSYSQDSGQQRYHNRYQAAEFYVQDDIRVTPRLTINAGFRASLFGTWYNAEDTAYNWEPQAFNPAVGSSAYINSDGYLANKNSLTEVPLQVNNPDAILTNGLVQCGKNGVPKSCMQGSVFHPGPRAGFAWDVFGKGTTSLRGGYGVFWEHGTSAETNVGSLIGSAPRVLSVTQIYSNSQGIPFFNCIGGGVMNGQAPTDANCVADGYTQDASGMFAPSATPLNITSIPTKQVYSYVQQWSLSIQHQFASKIVGAVAYAGTKGTHLSAEYNINQLPPVAPSNNPFGAHQPITTQNCGGSSGSPIQYYPNGAGLQISDPSQPFYKNLNVACFGSVGYGNHNSGTQPNAFRQYQGFSQIFALRNVAGSQYHGLQATLRRTAGAFDLGVAYTYSHSIDDASDRFNANFVNAYDLSQDKASSDFDGRHLLNISYIYDLPFLKLFRGVSGWQLRDATTTHGDGKGNKGTGLDSNAARTWLNGWQLTGITAYQTGNPFSVVNGGGSNGEGPQDSAGVAYGLNAGSYADVIGNAHTPKPPGGRNAQSFGPLLLNPSAFAAPRGLTYGNSGRNYLNNPARTNFNTALLKDFKLFGEDNLQLRAEAFNVFNHTQFRISDPTHPGNTGNNVISCYGGPGANYSAGGGDGSDCLTGSSFLHPVDAHDPRILQLGVKFAF